MSAQLDLFAPDMRITRTTRHANLAERFDAFDRANPAVYAALATLARRAVARGRTRIGIKAIFEICRWEYFIATGAADWKLDNSLTAYYARALMSREPDLQGVFEVRSLRAAA